MGMEVVVVRHTGKVSEIGHMSGDAVALSHSELNLLMTSDHISYQVSRLG